VAARGNRSRAEQQARRALAIIQSVVISPYRFGHKHPKGLHVHCALDEEFCRGSLLGRVVERVQIEKGFAVPRVVEPFLRPAGLLRRIRRFAAKSLITLLLTRLPARAGGRYTVTATGGALTTNPGYAMTNKAGPPASIAASAGTPQTATVNAAFVRLRGYQTQTSERAKSLSFIGMPENDSKCCRGQPCIAYTCGAESARPGRMSSPQHQTQTSERSKAFCSSRLAENDSQHMHGHW
jgi:hypothetical protein